MKKHRTESLLLSIFGSHHDESEVLQAKEEMDKKIEKIMELLSAEEKDDKSADALELVSLVKNFHDGYQTLYGRHHDLVGKLKKSVGSKKEMNGGVSDGESSPESDSSKFEASKDEGIPVQDRELLQQANENSSENAELLMKVESLKEELVVKDAEIQALSLKISEMVKVAEQTSVAVSIDFERLNKENSQFLIDHEGLKLELKAADGKISELEKMLELMKEEKHALNLEKESLISEKSMLLVRLNVTERSIAEFKTETDTLEDRRAVLQNENSVLKQEIETSSKQLSELRMQFTATVEEKDAIHSENATILGKIGQAEREIEELRKEVSVNLQLANEKSLENKRTLNEIEHLRINLEEANQQNVHLVQELNAAKEKNCVLESEMLNTSTQKREVERTIDELRLDYEALENERLKLSADNEELIEKLRAKDTANGELLDKIQQLEKLTDGLKAENEHSNSDLMKRLEVKGDEVRRLQNEFAEARREASVEIDAAMARANNMQAELDLSRNRGVELEEQVTTLTGRLSEERALMERAENELKTKIADQAASMMEQRSSFDELAAKHRLVEEELWETITKRGIALDKVEELEKGKEGPTYRLEVVAQELKRYIGKLEEEVAKLALSAAEKENAERETERLQREVDAVKVQLRLSNQKLKITEAEYKANEERDGRRIDELMEEHCSLQEQVMSLTSRTHLLESELARTRSVLEIELTSVGNAFDNLETAFEKNCRRLGAQLAKGVEELGAAREMSKALVSRKQGLEDEKRELAESARVAVLNLEEEVGGLRAKLSATVEEEEEFKEMAAENEKRVMELERKIREEEEEFKEMYAENEKRVMELERKIREEEEEFKEMAAQNEKRVMELERKIREEEEEGRHKDEEKREAIRQLCRQIEYHRQNSDRLSRLASSVGGFVRGNWV